MLNKQKHIILLVLFFVGCSATAQAQTGEIDTIVVDLATESTESQKKEPTPSLDLGALRKAAREDSIAIAKMAIAKEEEKKKSLEALKEKRLKEKEAKEKELKILAEKRKIEKEAREKAFAEKKALKEAAEKKKKKEKKLALEKAKKSKKEAAKKAATLKEEKDLAKKEAKLKKIETKLAKEKEITKQKKDERKEKLAKEAINSVNTTSTSEPKSDIAEIKEAASQEVEKEPKISKEKKLPEVPKGVEQKDNVYGTVRLAYDEQAASFLLSIPTETKMHYHKDHSEQIMLIEGQGMVLLGYKTIKLKRNELIFITKGTPHKIINSGKGKLKVLSIQAPFYQGKDKIILE